MMKGAKNKMNKKVDEITFKEFFDLANDNELRLSLIMLLKKDGLTEKQIEQMKMQDALNLLMNSAINSVNLVTKEVGKTISEQRPAPPTKPVNVLTMLTELMVVRRKFNLPKGLLFVPDKLEISVERVGYDSFNLDYKEFFNYLPSHILHVVIPMSVNMLLQVGLPPEAITRIGDNGVSIKVSNVKFPVMLSMILSELVIQKRLEADEIESIFNSVKTNRKAFTEMSELQYECNSSIEMKLWNVLERTQQIIQDNPDVVKELEAVVKKHTQSDEKGGKS